MSKSKQSKIMELALGRIFRLGSRPTQPGDIEQYEAARHAFLTAYDADPFEVKPDHSPNHVRDRNRGATGA